MGKAKAGTPKPSKTKRDPLGFECVDQRQTAVRGSSTLARVAATGEGNLQKPTKQVEAFFLIEIHAELAQAGLHQELLSAERPHLRARKDLTGRHPSFRDEIARRRAETRDE